MERVVVARPMIGICAMQVCAVADATDEEILGVSNRANPCGTREGWCSVVRQEEDGSVFKVKENLPKICADDPNRKHFIILC